MLVSAQKMAITVDFPRGMMCLITGKPGYFKAFSPKCKITSENCNLLRRLRYFLFIVPFKYVSSKISYLLVSCQF
jgi:hypothetical protein